MLPDVSAAVSFGVLSVVSSGPLSGVLFSMVYEVTPGVSPHVTFHILSGVSCRVSLGVFGYLICRLMSPDISPGVGWCATRFVIYCYLASHQVCQLMVLSVMSFSVSPTDT